MKKCKNLVWVDETLKNLLHKILQHSTHGSWLFVFKVCLNGGATFIIFELVDKSNLNIETLLQFFENLLLQDYSTNSSILQTRSPWVSVI